MQPGPATRAVRSVVGANIMCDCHDGRWTAADMSIEAGRIVSVVERGTDNAATQAPVAAADTFDATGCYAIPGLINAHAHLFSFGDLASPDIVAQAQSFADVHHDASGPFDVLARQCAAIELASGVTTLRCMGDFFEADIRLRDAVSAGATQGPHILCCGRPMTVAQGHGDGPIARKAGTPAEFRDCTRETAAQHPDFIKIFATGGVVDAKRKGEPGQLKMTAEQIAAVCDEAHAQGLHVSAHAESTEGVRVCLQSGVDIIEHGAALSSQCIDLFLQTGAVLVQTLSPGVGLAQCADDNHFDRTVQYNARFLLDQMVEGVQQARAAGIPVALGNDASCAFVPQYAFWREIAHTMRLCGLSAAEALAGATADNAAILQLEGRGQLAAGAWADIVFLRDNPLEDIRALEHPVAVLCRGAFAPLEYETIPAMDGILDTVA